MNESELNDIARNIAQCSTVVRAHINIPTEERVKLFAALERQQYDVYECTVHFREYESTSYEGTVMVAYIVNNKGRHARVVVDTTPTPAPAPTKDISNVVRVSTRRQGTGATGYYEIMQHVPSEHGTGHRVSVMATCTNKQRTRGMLELLEQLGIEVVWSLDGACEATANFIGDNY